MALVTASVLWKQTSDAEFRAWGKAMSDAMTAVGVPKTADTGQIDWSAVTYPSSSSIVKGYEIRKFNDTLQATQPVLIKFEWGSGGFATVPVWYITIGTATDGAGNLTGLTTVRKAMTGVAQTVPYTLRVSGDVNRLMIATLVDSGAVANSQLAVVERTHDSAGGDTAEGLIYALNAGAVAAIVQAAYLFGVGVTGSETAVFAALLPSVGTGANGSAVALYPIFCTKGVYFNPFLNILVAFQANVTPGTQLSFTYYGATRAFMPLNNASVGCAVRGAVAGTCVIVRDE
jgi:hypothetical protein